MEVTAPPFLISSLEREGQLHVQAALAPGKEPSVAIKEDARWTPESDLRSGEKKNILLTSGIELGPSSS